MSRFLPILYILWIASACNSDTSTENSTKMESFERKTGTYPTMESFGEQVFQLIAADQYAAIADLMPDLSEYQTIIKSSSLTQNDKDRLLNSTENQVKSNIESLKQTYNRLREETDRAGIDWAASQLDFIDFRHEKENKIEKADLILNFKYKGVNYKIELTDCLKYQDSWLMGHQVRFVKGYY